MRSTPPIHDRLRAVAEVLHHCPDHDTGPLLVHVVDDAPDVVLGLLPLPAGHHPFTTLAGLRAPDDWAAIGLRVPGTAHHLIGERPSEPTVATYVVHRSGREHALIGPPADTTSPPGPIEGTLPDACRRALGVPTSPAPPSTILLWTVLWLDRALQRALDPPPGCTALLDWPTLARLHPAVDPSADAPPTAAEVVAAAQRQARAWPWARLRAQPDRLPLPDGPLGPEVTQWMDDGFYARWAIGAFPSLLTLGAEVREQLDTTGRARLAQVLQGLLR